MKNQIHGFAIPKAVSEFLTEDSATSLDYRVLNRVFGVSFEMDLKCSYYCLEEESLALRKIQSDETAPIYGLERGATRDSNLLDAEHCLCLAVNQDEEGVCLDYRDEPESPSVLLSSWRDQPDDHATWITAAETFESFLAKYKGEQGGAGQPATRFESK